MAWRYSNSKVIAVLPLLNLLSAHTLAEAKPEAFSKRKDAGLALATKGQSIQKRAAAKNKKGPARP